jgi:hypothetical protein
MTSTIVYTKITQEVYFYCSFVLNQIRTPTPDFVGGEQTASILQPIHDADTPPAGSESIEAAPMQAILVPASVIRPVQSNSNQERALYITFFCLTTTFLLCHLPRIILNIYEVPMSIERDMCKTMFAKHYYQPAWVIILSCVEKFTLILNSSINFVYYCLAGKAFRQQMCKVVFSRMGRICLWVSEVLTSERHSDGYGVIESARPQRPITDDNADDNTGIASSTLDTGMTNCNTSMTEMSSDAGAGFRFKKTSLCKLKSIEEGADVQRLPSIMETLSIVEPLLSPDPGCGGLQEPPIRMAGSHPNLVLTVNMPYGSFLGHGINRTLLSKSQPDLKVTVALQSNYSAAAEKVPSSRGGLTKGTSTSDLFDCKLTLNPVDSRLGNDVTEDDDTYSVCSAGSHSSCGSSYNEACPHCLITTIDTKELSSTDKDKEVFL